MSGLRCQAKRGVMVLRSCGEPGVATCATCQRITCQTHLSPAAPGVCLDCAARQAGPATRTAPSVSNYNDDDWGRGVRVWLLYSGTDSSLPVFDESDRKSFEHVRDEDLADKPDQPGSALDS